jgi:hypothetical protein
LPPEPPLQLVIDEDASHKLSRELVLRGMDATSVFGLGWANQGIKDGALIKKLAERGVPCVLVAWDNKLPYAHRGQLDHFGITLAVIDKKARPASMTQDEYIRDVVHRHAHRMASQSAGSRFIYTQTRRRPIPYGS